MLSMPLTIIYMVLKQSECSYDAIAGCEPEPKLVFVRFHDGNDS